MSRKQPRMRIHRNPFTVEAPEVPEWNKVFGRTAPMALEIGFGPGEFLLGLAEKHPEWNVLGLEIRDLFVSNVLKAGEAKELHNLFAMVANANLHLSELVPDHSLAFVAINFPDPWFKKRHQKRRVLSTPFLQVLSQKMIAGATLHYMSDFEEGALEAQHLLRAHEAFAGEQEGDFIEDSTTALWSARERSHTKRGHRVFRLLFVRT